MSTASTNPQVSSADDSATAATTGWKREVQGKLAAARAKRLEARPDSSAPVGTGLPGAKIASPEARASDSRASRVAAAVAARYAHAQSYSEYLAAQESLSEKKRAEEPSLTQPALAQLPLMEAPGLRPDRQPSEPVRAERPVVPVAQSAKPDPIPARGAADASPRTFLDPAPACASDPLAEAWVESATTLPTRLLEFPRELVAARKARPRHAEGPLREDLAEGPQLRIFEVAPNAVSTASEAVPAATEWGPLRLDAPPPRTSDALRDAADEPSRTDRRDTSSRGAETPRLTRVASLADRLMAALVDGCLVGIAFLLFTLICAAGTTYLPSGKTALAAGALVLACLYLLYHFLFFTFSTGTPGMVYARIALCTFEDENPTHGALRKRIFALVLAAMPLGLGFLYALFDEERLGWHDRMTRIYQRSYR